MKPVFGAVQVSHLPHHQNSVHPCSSAFLAVLTYLVIDHAHIR